MPNLSPFFLLLVSLAIPLPFIFVTYHKVVIFVFFQVLEQRRQHYEAARTHFLTAQKLGPHNFEAFFNAGKNYTFSIFYNDYTALRFFPLPTACLAHKLGEFQESYQMALKAQAIFPEHFETKELLKTLRQTLNN